MAFLIYPHRRAFLLAGLAFGAWPGHDRKAFAAEAAILHDLVFEVHRGGALLGRHQVTFTRNGADLVAEGQVDMTVKLGPVSLFRYSHQARERWIGGRFDSLQTSTVTNGHKQTVSAARTGDAVMITPAEGVPYLADARVLPLTHWNRQVMSAPLFNPQDGKLMREHATAMGPDPVALADGRMVQADRYSLSGDTQIDDWYDAQGAWAALRGQVKDGSILIYRRVQA